MRIIQNFQTCVQYVDEGDVFRECMLPGPMHTWDYPEGSAGYIKDHSSREDALCAATEAGRSALGTHVLNSFSLVVGFRIVLRDFGTD